jgi:rfaE bifunctional protein nucleotidyltransferase chain/domain
VNKVIEITSLKEQLIHSKKGGKKIIFTNGCFDILHFGHVSYLQKAKAIGDILVIGLNSDDSIQRIKGPQRPIFPQKARAEVLAALSCVDWIVIFNEDTPKKLIEQVLPDVLVKGADWKGREVVGQDVVENAGGHVEFIEYVDNFSTTGAIEKILSVYRQG